MRRICATCAGVYETPPGTRNTRGAGHCPTCRPSQQTDHRPSRQRRGYDKNHDHERRRHAKIIAAGQGICAATTCLQERDGGSRHIQPDQPWNLDHTDDRTGYRGPAHTRCNTSAGGRLGAQRRWHTA